MILKKGELVFDQSDSLLKVLISDATPSSVSPFAAVVWTEEFSSGWVERTTLQETTRENGKRYAVVGVTRAGNIKCRRVDSRHPAYYLFLVLQGLPRVLVWSLLLDGRLNSGYFDPPPLDPTYRRRVPW